jgi:hypothetical protein
VSNPETDTPAQGFNTVLWSGNDSTQDILGLGHQPDLTWLKLRDGSALHRVIDSVRGATKAIYPDEPTNETDEATGLTAFLSDGFSLGNHAGYNGNPYNYVGWCWKKSVQYGLDIIKDLGTGVNKAISHNLGKVPEVILRKGLTTSSAQSWWMHHLYVTSGTPGPEHWILRFDGSQAAEDTDGFCDTLPTSTQFWVNGSRPSFNEAGAWYISYVFTSIEGFSKFGYYIGNGNADGAFTWCGFRPKLLIIKSATTIDNWYMYDTERDVYNACSKPLYADLPNAEGSGSLFFDILSNGFKMRHATVMNSSGVRYIFMAFAETPFKYANAR